MCYILCGGGGRDKVMGQWPVNDTESDRLQRLGKGGCGD